MLFKCKINLEEFGEAGI